MSIYISREHRFQILIRTIAVSALLISLLQGTLFILDFNRSLQNVIFICIALLTLITAWKCLQNFKSHLMTLVVILLLCQLGIFVFNLIRTVPPFPFRLLQVAILFLYLSTLISTLLILSWRINPTKIYLLIFSIALACFIGETTLGLKYHYKNSRFGQEVPRWSGLFINHPQLGRLYLPHSEASDYYPSNPRGYFQEENSSESKWRFFVYPGNVAKLEFLSDNPEKVKISIDKRITKTPWHIQLNHIGYPLRSNHDYNISFIARAAGPRTIMVASTRVDYPSDNLGLYSNIELTTRWQRFNLQFTPNADEDFSEIQFYFGNSNESVELSDLKITDLTNGEVVRPDPLLRNYFVKYNFNALGCRGQDVPIPKPSNTFRILLLGDSFTLGRGVHEKDTFAAKLEEMLNKKKKSIASEFKYEVVNCGVSGFNTKDERLFYTLFGSEYEPDVVLIVMTWNDDLSWQDEEKMVYVSRSAGKYESLFYIWNIIQDYRNRRPFPNYSEAINEILKLNEDVEENGARLGAVIFRNHSSYIILPRRSQLIKKHLIKSVSSGLNGSNIPLLDLEESLSENYSREDLFVYNDIGQDEHPNEIAYSIAAREIFAFLENQNLLRDR